MNQLPTPTPHALSVLTTLERQLSEWRQLLDEAHRVEASEKDIITIEAEIDHLLDTIKQKRNGYDPCKPNDPINVIEEHGYPGLTKREYFAGQIMVTLGAVLHSQRELPAAVAQIAVEQADALIAALNQ